MKVHFNISKDKGSKGMFYSGIPACQPHFKGYKTTDDLESVTCQDCISWLGGNTNVLVYYNLIGWVGDKCRLKLKEMRNEVIPNS